jgi:hypothetical protein
MKDLILSFEAVPDGSFSGAGCCSTSLRKEANGAALDDTLKASSKSDGSPPMVIPLSKLIEVDRVRRQATRRLAFAGTTRESILNIRGESKKKKKVEKMRAKARVEGPGKGQVSHQAAQGQSSRHIMRWPQ